MITEAEVESARREWEEGHRRLQDEARLLPAPERLLAQVDAVTAELRRRVGGTFTIRELAAAYARGRALEPRCGGRAGGCTRLASDALAGRGRSLPPVLAWRPGLRAVSVPERRRPARPARRNPLVRPGLIALGLLLLLLVGISIGKALDDGPDPGGTVTNVRTLEPQPLPPAERTVTVTVTNG